MDCVVEDIRIEMDPKAVEFWLGQALDCTSRRGFDSERAYGRQIKQLDARVFDALATVLVRIHRVAAPKNDNILVAYQRPAFLDVRDGQRPARAFARLRTRALTGVFC